MTNEIKITKAMVLEAIKAMVNGEQINENVTDTDIINYCDVTLAQMANKAEKAKAKAAEKRTAGDELKAVVAGILTDELQTRDAIFAQIEDESGELTVAKVGARLTQLVNDGVAVKEDVKIDKRTVKGYKLA